MKKPFDTFEAGFDRTVHFLAVLVAISIGLIAILIPLNLLLVKAHWGSIWWLNEGIEYTLYVGVFICTPWVLQQGAHVRVDVLTSALPKKLALRWEKILDGAGGALCLLICFYGVRATIIEFQDATLPDKDLRIANWYMMAVFAFSFALLAIEFFMRMLRAKKILVGEEIALAKAGF
ncbi:MAG: TRAP transporter small permease [Rhodospirillales bacterium]|nr:TRAP transporter small permease [Rhodospirillales bacterium]